MKKDYVIGLLTGCLLTTSVLIFVGATDNDSQVGRYQMSLTASVKGTVVRAMDTTNGQQYDFIQRTDKWNKLGASIKD